MSDVLLGAVLSASLVAFGIFCLTFDVSKHPTAKASRKQFRQAGLFGTVSAVAVAALTIYLFLRGAR